MATIAAQRVDELKPSDVRLVIAASSLGTVFEWYDFFIYGTLATIIGRTFFPADSEVAQLLLALAGFATPVCAIGWTAAAPNISSKLPSSTLNWSALGMATFSLGFCTLGAAACLRSNLGGCWAFEDGGGRARRSLP